VNHPRRISALVAAVIVPLVRSWSRRLLNRPAGEVQTTPSSIPPGPPSGNGATAMSRHDRPFVAARLVVPDARLVTKVIGGIEELPDPISRRMGMFTLRRSVDGPIYRRRLVSVGAVIAGLVPAGSTVVRRALVVALAVTGVVGLTGIAFIFPAPAASSAKLRGHPANPASVRRVALYGDSLSSQAQQFFVHALNQAGIIKVTTRTYGGTSICDWLAQMRSDATTLHPDAVVVQFSGNDLTPCMRGPDGKQLQGAAFFNKYESDASQVLKIFALEHTLVFFAGSPISRSEQETHNTGLLQLNAMYTEIGQFSAYGRYIDAGASVLLDGHWTLTLPCQPNEPCTGGRDANGIPINVVRAPDGGHFCPGAPHAVRGVTSPCTVWSSGAWRFGNAMATPVIRELLDQPYASTLTVAQH
jgi:hypothetical protein